MSSNKIVRKSSPYKQTPRKQSPPKKNITHKEMEETLNELHKLQLEIYELDTFKIPHRTSPVKKEIRQLACLHENMLKPKKKNSLDMSIQQIQYVFEVLEPLNKGRKISTPVLKKHVLDLFKCQNQEFDVLSRNKNQITAEELYEFLNYSEFDDFDVNQELFKLLDPNGTGRIDFNELDRLMASFGYGSVTQQMFTRIMGIQAQDGVDLATFKKIMKQASVIQNGQAKLLSSTLK